MAINWDPPIGIPEPTFGLHEVAPSLPNPWTSNVAGFYYIDEGHPASTDSANTYGYPAKPRKTIPRVVPEGSVVEIRGTYTFRSDGGFMITYNGSQARPIFVRGESPTNKAKIVPSLNAWDTKGSYYILENLDFDRSMSFYGSNYAALRNSDVSGTEFFGGIDIWGTNVVIYNNKIHDNGQWLLGTPGYSCEVGSSYNIASPKTHPPDCDQDQHGVSVAKPANNIWIIDNEMYYNSGNGVQVNAFDFAGAQIHHVYMGRNNVHHNKQAGLWTKQSTDVIISQNILHDHGVTAGGPQAGIGGQYSPERVWIIYNHIYDNARGIRMSTDETGDGTNWYAIGNLIHDIHTTETAWNPNDAWASAAFSLAGERLNRYIINNVIYDVDAGIYQVRDAGNSLIVINNIIGRLGNAQSKHIYIEQPNTAARSYFYNNILEGSPKIRWGSGIDQTIAQIEAANPTRSGANINTNPLFVDENSGNFRLQGGSPAIDAARVSDVYQTFENLYGLSIRVDPDFVPKPQGGAWDIGAFEFIPSGADVWPPSITSSSPNGLIGATTNVTLTISTNEAATCKYSLTRGQSYSSMPSTFTETGGLTHRSRIDNLIPGNTYNYSVKCTDGTNPNADDYLISFLIFPMPDCTLTAPTTVSPNVDFNLTWSASGASHVAYRITGGSFALPNGSLWPSEGDLFYLINYTIAARIPTGATTFSLCFDQAAYTGTYSQCLARNPNKICSKTISTTGTPVALEGDVNNDNSVNLQDIQSIVAYFSKISGYPPNVELASPGIIDLFDVMVVIKNWGRSG